MSKGLAILATIASLCILDTQATLEPRATSAEPANGYRTRSVHEIIYSCIVTIILCASYCIRPNLSAPNAPTFSIFLRKLNVAFWAVISPELVIFWAYKQWYHARGFAKTYNDRGWTIAHGQFVMMGGFILYHNDSPLQVLSIDTFTRLLNAGCIDFPSVTEQDIKIKSREHPFLAAVTLLQAAWLISQCIARGVQGLDITQLEAITMVLVGVHALLLPAWWHKPLDARSFVRIDAKALRSTTDTLRILHDELTIDGMQRDFARQNHLERNYLETLWNLEVPLERKHNLELSPSKIFPFATKMFTDYEQLYTALCSQIQPGTLEVPIFHAPNRYQAYIFVKMILGFLFASPYYAMWKSHFPNPYHEKVWHVASMISFSFSALTTSCCFLFCLFAVILLDCTWCLPHRRAAETILRLLLGPGALSAMLVVLVITGARIALIIEAFICLNSLSTTARLAVAWTNFIPHVT